MTDDLLPEKTDRLRSFMETGGQVVGQTAGAAVSLLTGPVLGAGVSVVLGNVFERVGLELYDRVLGPRQGARAAGALDVALVRVQERREAGDPLREDGFFDAGPDGRTDAEEVLEGTLLTAANAYEERKVAHIGSLYANLAFDPSVSAAHANFLLRMADRLTYRQLTALAFFTKAQGGDYERAVLGLMAEASETGRRPSPALLAEMDDLSDARLLGVRQNDGSVTMPGATYGSDSGWKLSNLGSAAPTVIGETLHRLMDLDAIPPADLDAILAELRVRLTTPKQAH